VIYGVDHYSTSSTGATMLALSVDLVKQVAFGAVLKSFQLTCLVSFDG